MAPPIPEIGRQPVALGTGQIDRGGLQIGLILQELQNALLERAVADRLHVVAAVDRKCFRHWASGRQARLLSRQYRPGSPN